MTTTLQGKLRLSLFLMASWLVLVLGLTVGPAAAEASVSNYCGGWQAPFGECSGAPRAMYQTYGWGDQGGVCVGIEYWGTAACTPYANTGVYSWNVGQNVYSRPWMRNNSSVNNFVHGVALTH